MVGQQICLLFSALFWQETIAVTALKDSTSSNYKSSRVSQILSGDFETNIALDNDLNMRGLGPTKRFAPYSGDYETGMSYSADYGPGMPYSGDYRSGMPYNGDYGSVMPNSGDYGSGMPNSGDYGSGMPYSGDYGSGMPYSSDYQSGMPYSGDYGSGMPYNGDYGSVMPNSGDYGSGMPYSGDYGSGMPYSGDYESGMPYSSDYQSVWLSIGMLCSQRRRRIAVAFQFQSGARSTQPLTDIVLEDSFLDRRRRCLEVSISCGNETM
ncbi:aggrecan core protein-like isoform x2 [Plakobranchus ocellatus]|uniref:Aggrecan core protein-like isoform x2 n=1 Tax=Plakobranchus ocellatus TaxID=259542 RepID=A0AAV4CZ96_9GAST|nr:aggrecan core protein-like isoform x2 [Plakobranchus ocellatus]